MIIRALIFDFGGIILRTEDRTPRKALAERFGMSERELEWLVFASPSSIRASVGEITAEEHWQEVAKTLRVEASEIDSIRKQFFAGDRLDHELVAFLRQKKGAYRIGLLSNAWGDLRNFLNHELGILDLFDEVIISAEVKVMKPDRAIYELAARKLGVNPNEAVFVDDMKENVEASIAAGMYGIHFRNTEQTLAEINSLIQKV